MQLSKKNWQVAAGVHGNSVAFCFGHSPSIFVFLKHAQFGVDD